MNFVEVKEYIAVRAKISFHEKKWKFILWVMPLALMVFIPLLPLQDGVDKYLMLVPLGLLFFAIHKLRSMPYKDEFLALQKEILDQIYNVVFDDSLFDSIELVVKLRKVNKVKVQSNYYDLEEVLSQMNVEHIE